jgi:hypothetical protein
MHTILFTVFLLSNANLKFEYLKILGYYSNIMEIFR